MSSSRPCTFNHLTFDSAGTIQLHFTTRAEAEIFISNQLHANPTIKLLDKANSLQAQDTNCAWNPKHACTCAVIYLPPALFDVIVGKNIYHPLRTMYQLMQQGSNAFTYVEIEHKLAEMDPLTQSFALRLITKAMFFHYLLPPSGVLSISESKARLLLQVINDLPPEVCDQISLLGLRKASTSFGFIMLAARDNAEIFSAFNAKLSADSRHYAILQTDCEIQMLPIALHYLPESQLTAYLNQLDPAVLTQAVLMIREKLSSPLKNTDNRYDRLIPAPLDKRQQSSDEINQQKLTLIDLQTQLTNQMKEYRYPITLSFNDVKYDINRARATSLLNTIFFTKILIYTPYQAVQQIKIDLARSQARMQGQSSSSSEEKVSPYHPIIQKTIDSIEMFASDACQQWAELGHLKTQIQQQLTSIYSSYTGFLFSRSLAVTFNGTKCTITHAEANEALVIIDDARVNGTNLLSEAIAKISATLFKHQADKKVVVKAESVAPSPQIR